MLYRDLIFSDNRYEYIFIWWPLSFKFGRVYFSRSYRERSIGKSITKKQNSARRLRPAFRYPFSFLHFFLAVSALDGSETSPEWLVKTVRQNVRFTQLFRKSRWLGKNRGKQVSIRWLKFQCGRVYFGRGYRTIQSVKAHRSTRLWPPPNAIPFIPFFCFPAVSVLHD